MTRTRAFLAATVTLLLGVPAAVVAVDLGAGAAPTVDGREWRELHETVGLSPGQVAGICPIDGATPCSGAVGGIDLSGWVWATDDQVRALLTQYAPGLGSSTQVTGIDGFMGATAFLSNMRWTTYTAITYFSSEYTSGWTATAHGGNQGAGTASFETNLTGAGSSGFIGLTAEPPAGSATRGVWLWRPVGGFPPPQPVVEETTTTARAAVTQPVIEETTTTVTAAPPVTEAVIEETTTTVQAAVTQPVIAVSTTTIAVTATTIAVTTTAPPAPPTCEGLDATIVGTDGDDALAGTDGADVIVGLGGDDIIEGLGGADVICGGDGDDEIHGGTGADRIFGDDGSDELHGDEGADDIDGGPGLDAIRAGGGKDRCASGELRMSSCAVIVSGLD